MKGDVFINTEEFKSPFSLSNNYELAWKKVDTRWKGTSYELANKKVKDIIETMAQIRIITGLQILKTFWPTHLDNGKKILSRLEMLGLIIKHGLKNKSKGIAFYTLGPTAYKYIDIKYNANWWLDLTIEVVLRQLTLNQLFLRLYKINYCSVKTMTYPLTASIIIQDKEFPVVVVRGDMNDILRELRWLEVNKLILVCENKEQIAEIGPHVQIPVRYTTDYEIFCLPSLAEAFFKWNTDKVEQDIVNIFNVS